MTRKRRNLVTLLFSSAPHSALSWNAQKAAINHYHERRPSVTSWEHSTTDTEGSDADLGYDNDDSEARSQFGTREYWDGMYSGMGDFSSQEYQWYYGWSDIRKHFTQYVPLPSPESSSFSEEVDSVKILVPGMGNDPILLDLISAGYKNITAFDYSEGAVERQSELLSYDAAAGDAVELHHMDARALKLEWTGTFDAILEKGCLDALYLSGDGNVETAAEELRRVLKPGGVFVSVSGVVPKELRYEIFTKENYEWLRDGSDDLKAGCFLWRKR